MTAGEIKARRLAKWATLIDHFKLTPDRIGALTDRQIEALYFHPRTSDGRIEPVEETTAIPEGSLMADLMQIDILAEHMRLRAEEVEALKEQVRDKWKRKLQGSLNN